MEPKSKIVQARKRREAGAQLRRAKEYFWGLAEEDQRKILFAQRVDFAYNEHCLAHDPPLLRRDQIEEICLAHDAAMAASTATEEYWNALLEAFR